MNPVAVEIIKRRADAMDGLAIRSGKNFAIQPKGLNNFGTVHHGYFNLKSNGDSIASSKLILVALQKRAIAAAKSAG